MRFLSRKKIIADIKLVSVSMTYIYLICMPNFVKNASLVLEF